MAVCEVYENLYSECAQKALQSTRTTAALAEELEMALPRLYASVMVFAMKARSFFEKANSLAGHTGTVQLLLDHGRGSDLLGDSASLVLGSAAWRGVVDIAKLLFSRPGVEADHKNPNGRTPLSLASQKGHHLVVETLLTRHDVDVNSQGKTEDTPLIWAAYCGHSKSAAAILSHPNINPNAKNNYGDVALNYTIRDGHVQVVQMLLASLAIEINTSSVTFNSPIHEATLFAPAGAEERLGHNECLKLLIERRHLRVNVTRATGDTVLTIAVERGFTDQVAILLTRRDVDRHHANAKGETPLSLAKWFGYDKIVALLQEGNLI